MDLFWHIFTFPLSRKQCLRRREFVSLLSDEKEKIICVRDGVLCIMLAVGLSLLSKKSLMNSKFSFLPAG